MLKPSDPIVDSKNKTNPPNEHCDNPKQYFCDAVDQFEINNKTVRYDLEVTQMIDAANEFMTVFQDYCKQTKNERVVELFKGDAKKTIRVSEILQALNGDQTPFYFYNGDMELFNKCVTKYMLSAGWLADFPMMIFKVNGIAMLRLEIAKFILANWNWIEALYNCSLFKKFARQYGEVSLKNSAPEERSLRRSLVRKCLEAELAEYQRNLEKTIDEITAEPNNNLLFSEEDLSAGDEMFIELENSAEDNTSGGENMKQLKCVGALIGDIIGSTYEFDHTQQFYDFKLFNGKNSFFTDDSVMTIATMDKLLNGGTYTEKYQKWGRKYPDCTYGVKFAEWLESDNPKPYNSCGNGSAMRVSPIGWFYDELDDVLEEAKNSSIVSHDHLEGIKAAQAVASAVFLARKGKKKSEIRQFISEKFGYDLSPMITDLQANYEYSELAQKSVPESIICFLDSTDFEDAIRLAVSLNGDTDTMAAIAGSIAEAHYRKEIPDKIYKTAMTYLSDEFIAMIEEFNKKIPKTS
ncbi:MAG: ADP-ribosylglycohydrolase family protein [Candidatus Nomurabacteria bacterium]|jgi:ADP-ribosylglycohydrolase|nr:ADP-ribosylglycohydrolase family protein [Candidatus Nomurabacteria bacterium]